MKKACNRTETGCKGREPSWSNPDQDTLRDPQYIEVSDNHQGPVYCSYECAAYDGAFSVKTGYKLDRLLALGASLDECLNLERTNQGKWENKPDKSIDISIKK